MTAVAHYYALFVPRRQLTALQQTSWVNRWLPTKENTRTASGLNLLKSWGWLISLQSTHTARLGWRFQVPISYHVITASCHYIGRASRIDSTKQCINARFTSCFSHRHVKRTDNRYKPFESVRNADILEEGQRQILRRQHRLIHVRERRVQNTVALMASTSRYVKERSFIFAASKKY